MLVLIGNDENFFDAGKAAAYARKHLQHATITLVEKAGHLGHVDNPGAYSSAMVNFVKGLDPNQLGVSGNQAN